ncbi:MAG: Holliday junction branch migration DNA helicase RuvB [Candidatus Cloacimonetes bacterium]|nr:Holliday junction branch migration DNA helicase RuvB [Candidatus Cloacimonadota bacterium]
MSAKKRQTLDERLTSPIELGEDVQVESLRPLVFEDFLGQTELKEKLDIFIQAANQRTEALDHVLLSGPPGLGKTTFAKIIANSLCTNFVITSGPAIERQGDLAAILTNLGPRDVLFIDEIHRLKLPVEEILYSAMEDYKLDIIVGKGPDARNLRIDLPPFTLVGATTKSGLLSAPLRDRFGILGQFEFYNKEQLAQIVTRSASILEIKIEKDGALEIASRSRGTPRIANRLLKRVRDVAQVKGRKSVDLQVSCEALALLNVNELGLEVLDLKILKVLCEVYEGNPVGLSTLSISVGEDDETISEVCEPYLIQLGFVERTPRGRKSTPKGNRYYQKWVNNQD